MLRIFISTGIFPGVGMKMHKISHFEKHDSIVFHHWKLMNSPQKTFTDWSFEKRSFEASIWRMNFKACTFERLALIFGFGRGAQVGKTSLLEVNLYGASVDVGRIHFLFGTLQALGSHQNPRYLEEDVAFVLTMRSQNSETITFQAAVRCCVTATLASETFWQHRQTCT